MSNLKTEMDKNDKEYNMNEMEQKITEEKQINSILLNFKILSNVKEYDKLFVSGDQIMIDTPSITQGIIRRLYGESRTETINKINDITEKIFKYIDNLMEDVIVKTKKNMEELGKIRKQKANTLRQRRKLRSYKNVTINNVNNISCSDSNSDDEYNTKLKYPYSSYSSKNNKSINNTSDYSNESDINSDNDDIDKFMEQMKKIIQKESSLINDKSKLQTFDDTISEKLQEYVKILDDSIKGLQNLKITYIKDAVTSSQIDNIISKIKNRVGKINGLMSISPQKLIE